MEDSDKLFGFLILKRRLLKAMELFCFILFRFYTSSNIPVILLWYLAYMPQVVDYSLWDKAKF